MKKPFLRTVSSTMQQKEKVKKIKDESLNTAISQIEQSYGKGSIMKLGDNKQNIDVSVVSTGSIGLDIALGIGGYPRGRIVEIYGSESSGKTTLANEMAPLLNAKRLNADEVRKAANDWDFSEEGRVRQAKRMAEAALKLKAEGHYVIADFIAPTPEARSLFPADFRVWVDTIKEGRFEDTNKMFVKPKNFDFHVTTQDAKNWAPKIIEEIKK